MRKLVFLILLTNTCLPCALQAQTSLDATTITRLYYAGKIWGVLKYFHPQVAAGNKNWDSILIQTIPKVTSAKSDVEFTAVMLGMIAQAGPVFKPYPPAPSIPAELQLNNWTWLTDQALASAVRVNVDTVRMYSRPQLNYYVSQGPAGNPTFENDRQFYQYGDTLLPSPELRLLALFRYWNTINYFFPSRKLATQLWDTTLKEFIPKLWGVLDSRGYHTTMLELSTRTNDGQAAAHSTIITNQIIGTSYLPLALMYIGTETVVSKVLGDSLPAKPGDIIRKINGIDIHTIRDSIKKYTQGSTTDGLEHSTSNRILLGQQNENVRLLLENASGQREVVLKRIDPNVYFSLLPATGPVWKTLISPDSQVTYGYVDIRRLKSNDVSSMFTNLWSTDAIIFDCRNVPQGTLPEIVRYLFPTSLYNSNLLVPDVRYPGTMYWTPTYVGINNLSNPYNKAITVLVDEETAGQAEQMVMALGLFQRCLKIGSQTAGAIGEISTLYLPGGITEDFTGLGVYTPKGDAIQRTGIIVDLLTRPTISGIRKGVDEVLETALSYVARGPDSLAQLVWNWQTPFPQWNDLHAVYALSANTAFVVGQGGTILKTTNGGQTWNRMRVGSSINQTFRGVWFVNANTGFAVGDLGIIVRTTDAGFTWTPTVVDQGVNFYSVFFTDANTGTAVGYPGSIYRTTDGGDTWNLQLSGPASYLRAVWFTDSNTGTIVGSSGAIFQTTNGGARWYRQLSGFEETQTDFTGVTFTDALKGTIVGTGGIILRTTDRGKTWTKESSGTSYQLYGVTFMDAKNGMVFGDGGAVFRTTDGGVTWDTVLSQMADWFAAGTFVNATTGFVVGASGTIIHTTDGGTTWGLQTTGPRKLLYGVSFTDDYTGTAVGYKGSVFHTTDGGATWLTQTSGTTQDLRGITFPSRSTGIAVGENGTVLRTTNSGATWTDQSVPVTSGTEVSFTSVSFGSSTDGVIVGEMYADFPPDLNSKSHDQVLGVRAVETRSIILTTSNGGETWDRQTLSHWKQRLTAVSFGDPITATAVGDLGYILRTTDRGATWTGTDYPISGPLYGVCSVGRNVATVVGDLGVIYRTTNGGKSWVSQPSGTMMRLNAVWFVSDLHGVVVGDSGTMLITNNGGDTWNLVTKLTLKNLNAVCFSDVFRGYIVGEAGTIFSTAPGGIPMGVSENNGTTVPLGFSLAQNYPNPFNGMTNLEFRVPTTGFVTLKVFDLLGREVSAIINEECHPGVYRVTWDASRLPSGVYFCRLQTHDFVQTKKMILLK